MGSSLSCLSRECALREKMFPQLLASYAPCMITIQDLSQPEPNHIIPQCASLETLVVLVRSLNSLCRIIS